MYTPDSLPACADIPEPIPQRGELLITMKAAALKHLDRSRASGQHYSVYSETSQPRVIGGDGIGLLENGRRVYAIGNDMMAEKAVVEKDRVIPVPDVLDDSTAAALPNAVIGSAMALRFRAGMKRGETVLINGATGFTGRIATQVARHYGAKKIIVTGRDEQALQSLPALGADELIRITPDEEAFAAQIKAIHARTPIDVIIDYLWGRTAELILSALKGRGLFTHPTRFVSIGAVAGDTIQLSAENLRSVDLQLSGSGLGSWKKQEVKILLRKILPEMFRLAAKNKLSADTLSIPLQEIGQVWERDAPAGKRVVVLI